MKNTNELSIEYRVKIFCSMPKDQAIRLFREIGWDIPSRRTIRKYMKSLRKSDIRLSWVHTGNKIKDVSVYDREAYRLIARIGYNRWLSKKLYERIDTPEDRENAEILLAFVEGTLTAEDFIAHRDVIAAAVKNVRSDTAKAEFYEMLDTYDLDAEEISDLV